MTDDVQPKQITLYDDFVFNPNGSECGFSVVYEDGSKGEFILSRERLVGLIANLNNLATELHKRAGLSPDISTSIPFSAKKLKVGANLDGSEVLIQFETDQATVLEVKLPSQLADSLANTIATGGALNKSPSSKKH